MHPVLFEIFGKQIYTYGPIMALGFLLGFALMYKIATRRNEDVEFYMDLYIWVIIFGLVGSKLLYNIIEYDSFLEHPIKMLNPREGGLVWYGGVIAVNVFLVWYAKRRGMPFLQITDTLAAPLALGLAIGRWGCLMGGCCYGKACDLPWAIHYPHDHETLGLGVHPTPLYESFSSLILAAAIYVVINRGVRRGVPTLIWFTAYPIIRIVIEFFRGDKIRGFVIEDGPIPLSTSQFIGVILVVIAAGAWVWIMKRPPVYEIAAAPDSEDEKDRPMIIPAHVMARLGAGKQNQERPDKAEAGEGQGPGKKQGKKPGGKKKKKSADKKDGR